MPSKIDYKIVKQFQMGNITAFEQVLKSEDAALINFIKRHVRQEEYADDIYQEFCLRLWRSRGQLKPPFNVRAWMYSIVRVSIRDFLRRNEWSYSVIFSDDWESTGHCDLKDPNPDPREQASRMELRRLLSSEIERLDTISKEILLLRYIRGFKLREISEIMNIPRGTVSERLKSSLKLLQRFLKSKNIDLSSILSEQANG